MRTFLLPLAVALVVIAVYANSLRDPFVLDDLPSIEGNASLRDWTGAWHPPVESSTDGRPLLNLSFALNYAISGQAVWSYHLVNLVIHLGCALLLYALLRRAFARPWLAALAAVIWAVHPLTTEAVTYTVQRAESLMALFYLLTLYGFVRYVESGKATGRSAKGWAVVAIACCFLGTATKEVMVSAPIVVWLYDRTFLAGSFGAALGRRWAIYLGLASSWILLAALVVSTHGRGGTAGFNAGLSVWAYGLTQFRAIALYLKLCLWPDPLVFYYGEPVAGGLLAVLPQMILVGGLLLATVWALRRRPVVGFLGACFFLILAPSSSIVPVATETIAEHRMYLALIPVVILLVAALHRWLGPRAGWVLVPVAGCLAALTVARNDTYSSAFRLWSDTVRADPGNAWAHNNLGYEYDLRPDGANDAIRQYRIAVALRPAHAEAHYNLANDLRRIPGELPNAVEEYTAALAANPAFPKAHNNLGVVLTMIPGHTEEAIAHYQAAIRLYPGYAEAHFNLGNAWMQLGQHESDAIAEYQTALRLRPDYSEAHNNLGSALLQSPGDVVAAAEHFRRAVELDPRNASARYNLAIALLDQAGHEEEAQAQLRAVLQLQPQNADARQLLDSLPPR